MLLSGHRALPRIPAHLISHRGRDRQTISDVRGGRPVNYEAQKTKTNALTQNSYLWWDSGHDASVAQSQHADCFFFFLGGGNVCVDRFLHLTPLLTACVVHSDWSVTCSAGNWSRGHFSVKLRFSQRNFDLLPKETAGRWRSASWRGRNMKAHNLRGRSFLLQKFCIAHFSASHSAKINL